MFFKKRVLYFIIFVFLSINNAFAIANDLEWKEINAKVNLIKIEGDMNLQTNGTVLGMLLKENNRNLNSLIEKDNKTLLNFSISYKASFLNDKKPQTTIIQYGLYRTLDNEIQKELENKGIRKTPVIINIRYFKNSPIIVQFLTNKKWIDAPVLLTQQ